MTSTTKHLMQRRHGWQRAAAALAAGATLLMTSTPAQAEDTPPTRGATEPPAATVQTLSAPLALPQAEVEKLLSAYALIKRNYVGQADDNKLFDGAIAGMLASLDAHSQYLNKDDMRELDRTNTGRYVGVGIEVEVDHDRMRVVSSAEDSPAERAGIAAGDILVAIDGKAIAGLSNTEVARRMHGAPGSVVALGVARGNRLRTLRLTRAALNNATVRVSMAAPGLAWIRVAEFGGATGAELAAALKKLDAAKEAPRGLILDLRNDPGGLVSAGVAVAGAFLEPGTELFSARGQVAGANATVTVDQRYYQEPGEADVLAGLPAWTRSVPLTVLVNGASASAAELVAGALQDQRRATVVGTQTFGKGSIQSVIPLGPDSGIKFTVARYFTPKGREIQAQGVTPDIVVAPKAGAQDDLLLRESDLANHLPASTGASAAPTAVGHNPVESTRMFGTRDDKALQAAVALLAPQTRSTPTLAGLLRKWGEELKPGNAGGAP